MALKIFKLETYKLFDLILNETMFFATEYYTLH